MERITKVYVVYKTHLDIGFTDLAQNVVRRYLEEYIPQAIETAQRVRAICGPGTFVWTVGAWLIHACLQRGNENVKERLVQAIRRGDVDWHLLPCTTHTELMDEELFRYGIRIGKELDRKFGKHHFTGKMTDVPGHTAAMIPCLQEEGIRYLHIGINAASRPVNFPALCRFRYGGAEVVLNYARDYGEPCVLGDVALEFARMEDNEGPPMPDAVEKELARLGEKYPGAQILSEGLELFAKEAIAAGETLPVVEGEPGDTWIHGAAADPWKTGMLCELKRLGEKWRKADAEAGQSEEYRRFMENMLLACEHTCGLDSKRYFPDRKSWNRVDFCAALKTPEAERMEMSWKEQRGYLERAAEALPEDLKEEAREAKKKLRPEPFAPRFGETAPKEFCIAGWRGTVLEDGSLRILSGAGREFRDTALGILRYETYSPSTVAACYADYNRNQETEGEWAEPDFAKPGLAENSDAADRSDPFWTVGIRVEGETISVDLRGNETAVARCGCPKNARLSYLLRSDGIKISLSWNGKEKCRMPEATWLGFRFDSYRGISLRKMGKWIDPFCILDGGNKRMHAAERIRGEEFEMIAGHAPVVSIGGRNLYDTRDSFGDLGEGLHFLLHDNRWNTNFPLWYGENAAFELEVIFRKSDDTKAAASRIPF